MHSRKLLRAEEVAEILSLKVATIRRMILERRIETVKLGRSVRIPLSVVERLIEAGRRGVGR